MLELIVKSKTKLLLLIPFFLLGSLFSSAQTWEKTFNTLESETGVSLVKKENNFILTYLETKDLETKIKIKTLNNNGNTSDSIIILPENGYAFKSISKATILGDTLFIVGEIYNITSSDGGLVFILYNFSNQNVLQKRNVKSDTLDMLFDYTITDDGIIIPGYSEILNEPTLFAYLKEFDFNGNLVAEAYYPNYVFSSGYLWGTNLNKYSARTVNSFDLRFNRSDFTPIDTVITSEISATLGGVITSSYNNSTHYISGRYFDTLDLNPYCESLKLKHDSILTQVYRFGRTDKQNKMQGVVSVAESDSNILYMVGSSAEIVDPRMKPYNTEIALFKTNQYGDTLFLKFYKGEVHYIANSIIATPDGGALIASMKYDWNSPYPNQWDIHLLKVDSLGNYTPLSTSNIEKPEELKAVIYPNPATNQISIKGVFQFPATLTIYDILGRKLKRVMLYSTDDKIDISTLNSGTYLYQIISNNKLARGKFVVE